MKYPIGIISFNRPQYVAEQLNSLSAQSGDALKDREIHFFQDGGTAGGCEYARPSDIDECVRLFNAHFPNGTVHRSQENIGHIRNVLRMEEHFFAGKELWPAAMFLEDDVVLSPHYVAAMDRLIEHALEAGDISYVRCIHPARHSQDEQELNKHKTFLPPVGQMWGYGLTREYWQKERAALDLFYGMALTHPYRELDQNLAQLQWWQIDAPIQIAELDYAKVAATKHLGYAQLTTYCVMARYIGRQGVHFNSDIYESQGWHLVPMFEGPLEQFDFPTSEEKQAAVAAQREANQVALHIRINLEAEKGSDPVSGWLKLNTKYGFDLANEPLRDFKDNSVEIVYLGHVLQKLPARKIQVLLADVRRVLKAGGVVRISAPSLDILTEQMLQGDLRMESFLDSVLPERDRNQSARLHYLHLLGNAADLCRAASDYGQVTPLGFHRMAYMLIAAGFEPSKIRKSEFRSSSLPDLRDEALDSHPNHSFFVEAIK